MTAAGEWMCPVCARTVAGCQCSAAGLTPPKPVWVPADALERAEASFVSRRSVLPPSRPPGVSAAEAAHMRGDCEPRTCQRCALLREMRGETG